MVPPAFKSDRNEHRQEWATIFSPSISNHVTALAQTGSGNIYCCGEWRIVPDFEFKNSPDSPRFGPRAYLQQNPAGGRPSVTASY